jgi:hypothetical protein
MFLNFMAPHLTGRDRHVTCAEGHEIVTIAPQTSLFPTVLVLPSFCDRLFQQLRGGQRTFHQ